MTGKVEVEVVVSGKHTMEIPKGIGLLLGKFLKEYVPIGHYNAFLGRCDKGGSYRQGEVKPRRPKPGLLTLIAQPGGNETCHEVHVKLGKLDVYDIFKRMKGVRENGKADATQTEKSELTAVDFVKTEGTAQVIETSDIQNKGVPQMEEKETSSMPIRTRLDINKLLNNQETLQYILLFLSDHQEKVGYIDAKACNVSLSKSSLLGIDYSKKSTSRIFPALVKEEYLVIIEKGHYAISDKGKELLALHPVRLADAKSLAGPAPKITVMAGSLDLASKLSTQLESSEIDQKLQSRIELMKELSHVEKILEKSAGLTKKAEESLDQARENERQAQEVADRVKARILADLNL